MCYLAPGVINSTTLAENTRYVRYSYQSPNEDYVPQQGPSETLLTDCPVGSSKGRPVRCFTRGLESTSWWDQGTGVDSTQPPTLTVTLTPRPRPWPQNRTQNGPKTGEKRATPAFVCNSFFFPNPQTTISRRTL